MKTTTKLYIFILLSINVALSQYSKIEGRIFEVNTNSPIETANIVVKDTEFGTTSDERGNFYLILNNIDSTTLIVSHIGYEKKEVKITSQKSTKIYLTPKILLGEGVIIEGVQKHSDREISSKIEVVQLKTIDQRGVRDISEILSELESVNINTTPYGKQTISIRGSNSNEVAVYLDGIKLNNSATGSADLAYIDLNDLDEIEVIKGGASTLFGAGNFGGVVLLHSKSPLYNSIEINRGFGVTEESDEDLSASSTLKIGPIGLYGRYSGKSRLFDGRTLFTSIFGNYGGLLSFKNQELVYRHVEYDKYLEFPSGDIVSADELMVNRFTFFGNILNTTGWDIQIGKKEWSWKDDFFSNLSRNISDEVLQYRINKGFQFNQLSGSIQFEDETQDYIGNQTIKDSYMPKYRQLIGSLNQHDRGIAGILRYDIQSPVQNISLIRWEGGIRYSSVNYTQNQKNSYFGNWNEVQVEQYNYKDNILLSTYRLGIYAEGMIGDNIYKLFFNQGFNNRLPTLNDRFIWTDGSKQLNEYIRRLNTVNINIGGSSEIEGILAKAKSIQNLMSDELSKEFINSTEFSGQIILNHIDHNSINKIELGAGIFRNYFVNKIAYISLDDNSIVPYNTNTSWLNGAELNIGVSAFDDVFNIKGNITWVQPSDQEIFPNKPSTTGNILLDIRKDWFHLNMSHLFNGPQYYLHGGASIERLQKQKNTNLTISATKHFWYFDATLSYSIRNIFSDETTVISAGTQTGDIFNYYDAHRKLINLKISLSDR